VLKYSFALFSWVNQLVNHEAFALVAFTESRLCTRYPSLMQHVSRFHLIRRDASLEHHSRSCRGRCGPRNLGHGRKLHLYRQRLPPHPAPPLQRSHTRPPLQLPRCLSLSALPDRIGEVEEVHIWFGEVADDAFMAWD